jgi:outer membrane biogenesis lipoprotein LolB
MFFELSFMVFWHFVVALLAACTPTTTRTSKTSDETTEFKQYDS